MLPSTPPMTMALVAESLPACFPRDHAGRLRSGITNKVSFLITQRA
jgi:hypothetical protein